MKKLIIGVCGYIGSGKTVVGRYLEELGASFIESDKVVDDLYRIGGDGYKKIVSYLGEDFLLRNMEINRKKIAKMIFGDKNKLRIVNNLIHPLITAEIKRRIDSATSNIVFIEGVYFEPENLGKLIDKIIWIECDKSIMKRRVMKRQEIDEDLFENIVLSQEKPVQIDYSIENNNSIADLRVLLDDLWSEVSKC